MARCKSCSAPLPANINRCSYCNVRNDVDLHKRHKYSVQTKASDRICPHCETELQTVKLDVNGPLFIERCKSCFGLFFDAGEIETLLEHSVSNVSNINLALIKNINKDRFQSQRKIKYVKCPVCRILMNRVNFGHRSGVIVDQCSSHGIWLDSGEATHLMEWKKAGGQLLHSKNEAKEKSKKKTSHASRSYDLPDYTQRSKSSESELLESVSSLIYKFFS